MDEERKCWQRCNIQESRFCLVAGVNRANQEDEKFSLFFYFELNKQTNKKCCKPPRSSQNSQELNYFLLSKFFPIFFSRSVLILKFFFEVHEANCWTRWGRWKKSSNKLDPSPIPPTSLPPEIDSIDSIDSIHICSRCIVSFVYFFRYLPIAPPPPPSLWYSVPLFLPFHSDRKEWWWWFLFS